MKYLIRDADIFYNGKKWECLVYDAHGEGDTRTGKKNIVYRKVSSKKAIVAFYAHLYSNSVAIYPKNENPYSIKGE